MTLVEWKANAPRSVSGGLLDQKESPRAARWFRPAAQPGALRFSPHRRRYRQGVSSHTRTLDRIGRLADERAVDALLIIRRKPWHWPVVTIGLIGGAAVGLLAPSHQWFFVLSGAIIGGGLGMNIGTDFRCIARTPTRVLLLDSSRVNARPVRVVRAIAPTEVHPEPARITVNLGIDGEAHVMARQQLPRLERMLVS